MKNRVNPSVEDDRGSLFEFVVGSWRQVNILTSKAGSTRGQHYHKDTREKFVVLSGEILFTLSHVVTKDQSQITLTRYESLIIEPYTWHQLEFLTDSTLLSFYSCEFEPDKPDIFRL